MLFRYSGLSAQTFSSITVTITTGGSPVISCFAIRGVGARLLLLPLPEKSHMRKSITAPPITKVFGRVNLRRFGILVDRGGRNGGGFELFLGGYA